MKNSCCFLLMFFIFGSINSQTIVFADTNFKQLLLSASTESNVADDNNFLNMKVDVNDDGEIQVSEASQVYGLYVNLSQLTSLEGIQYFTNLRELECYNNLLTSLDLTALSNLRKVSCDNNNLTSLNVTGLNNLTDIICYNNQLTSLDASGLQSLIILQCSNNQLTSLNASGNMHLEGIDCQNNQLVSLDVTGDVNLTYLNCVINQLPSLDVSGLNNLHTLYCTENNLTSLNINGATFLSNLQCGLNQLTAIDLSDLSLLSYFSCSSNNLTSLDIPYTSYQLFVGCSNNNLTHLNIKNGVVESSLDFSGNPNLQYVCADENELSAVESKIIQYGYLNCVLNSYCSFNPGGPFYVVEGNTKLDGNNTGCDASDLDMAFQKFNVTNGTTTGTTVSSLSGNYTIPLQTGSYSVTPVFENPSYFSISPSSLNVTFPAQSSPLNQNFCITPVGIHNDLEVTLLPLNIAQPGFDTNYIIVYKNKGNQTKTGTLALTFDDTKIDYLTSNPTFTSQSINQLLWNYTDLVPSEIRIITCSFNLNSPTETPSLNSGDVLSFTTTINPISGDELPSDNVILLEQIVTNSFDPNDKRCIEGTTITPAMVGQYVHYIIRFENNGTANAENIVIKDMIDTFKFDINSLIPINSSHTFTTRITNTNQVEFIFENIQLPFDDANNDGYVAFKIKTKPTLVEGNTFSNTASIYFDYNFPIITNTATTTIQALSNTDFEFSDYFQLAPNPVNANLNIFVKEAIEVSSISIYNTLGQLILVVPNAQEITSIDVSQLTSGTYFIKVMSDKGSSNSKFIKQ